METLSTNELRIPETNSHPPPLPKIIFKFLVYFIVYIIIPFYIWINGSQILGFYIRPIIPDLAARVLIWILVTHVGLYLYIKLTQFFFRKFELNLKIELRNYLTHNGRKISYYKFIVRKVEELNMFIRYLSSLTYYCEKAFFYEIFISLYLFFGSVIIWLSMSYWLYFTKSLFNFDIFQYKIFINSVNNFNTDVVIIFFYFFTYITFLTLCLLFLFKILNNLLNFILNCIFPLIITEELIIKDTSDFPISFIKKAIEEIEVFDFSNNFEQCQIKKNHIIKLIDNAIYPFIKVDYGNTNRFICGTNVFYPSFAQNISNAARFDVIFRINGLYKKMDDLCASINKMNKPEEQSRIVQELKKCLKAIENRDLSEFETVEFKIPEDVNPSLTQIASIIIKRF